MAHPATSLYLGEEEIAKEQATQISQINERLESLTTIPQSQSPPSISRSPSQTSSFHTTTDSNHAKEISTPQTPTSDNTPEDFDYDLICIGFGPASLAIGIALHDKYTASSSTETSQTQSPPPKVLYLSNQSAFSWHSGMQLPSTKMQISFLKDLATPRLPTSRFTFLNYLHDQKRLDHFINLGTFLPARREYEDYLRWCARWFEGRGEVEYGVQVEGVVGVVDGEREGEKVGGWDVVGSRAGAGDGEIERCTWRAKHVVIAAGGQPAIPPVLQGVENVYHSSVYAYQISQIEEAEKERKSEGRKLRLAVIGSGQSAAEIFNDLWDRFGDDAEVKLVVKGTNLRPSDDSPFVNEIFNPSKVSQIYALPPSQRAAAISLDRSTNYGVVRLELLERLYEKMYEQRFENPDESQWRCQILPNRIVRSVSTTKSASAGMVLKLGDSNGSGIDPEEGEELEVDYVFTATGYIRNAHESMLEDTKKLLSISIGAEKEVKFPVGRDYRVLFDEEKVDHERAGVWLQGCNEGTHGLSDTLLSILAVRGGEVVDSIFGKSFSGGKEE